MIDDILRVYSYIPAVGFFVLRPPRTSRLMLPHALVAAISSRTGKQGFRPVNDETNRTKTRRPPSQRLSGPGGQRGPHADGLRRRSRGKPEEAGQPRRPGRAP